MSVQHDAVQRADFDQFMVPNYAPAAFVPVRGLGSRVWDQSGRELIDFAGGIAVNVLGHAHPRLVAAVTELFAPQIHQSRLDAWPQHYPWIDATGYDYFRKRLKEARRDVEHGLRITLEHYRTREAQERMLQILQFKLDVLWSMLDAMSMAYELQRPPYHTVTNERAWHRGIAL